MVERHSLVTAILLNNPTLFSDSIANNPYFDYKPQQGKYKEYELIDIAKEAGSQSVAEEIDLYKKTLATGIQLGDLSDRMQRLRVLNFIEKASLDFSKLNRLDLIEEFTLNDNQMNRIIEKTQKFLCSLSISHYSGIRRWGNHIENLIELKISHNENLTSIAKEGGELLYFSALTTLELRSNGKLAQLLVSSPKLENLIVEKCDNLGNDAMDAIVKSSRSSLRSLTIFNCAGVTAWTYNFENLIELSIKGNKNLTSFATGNSDLLMFPMLEKANFSDNNLNKLLLNSPKLEYLDLTGLEVSAEIIIDCDNKQLSFNSKLYKEFPHTYLKNTLPVKDSFLRITFLGAPCSGRTSFIKRLMTGQFCENTLPTIGYEPYYCYFDDWKIQMVDTSGQPRYAEINKKVIKNSDVFIFFINSCDSYHQTISDLASYMSQIGMFDKGCESTAILVAWSKIDLLSKHEPKFKVDEEDIAQLIKSKMKNPDLFLGQIHTSSKEFEGFREFLKILSNYLSIFQKLSYLSTLQKSSDEKLNLSSVTNNRFGIFSSANQSEESSGSNSVYKKKQFRLKFL